MAFLFKYRDSLLDLLADVDLESEPSHACAFTPRFPQFHADGASNWQTLLIQEKSWSPSKRDKVQRALKRWCEFADATDQLWVNTETAVEFIASRETRSVTKTQFPLNAGEFQDLVNGLTFVFDVQYAVASALLASSDLSDPAARQHVQCAVNHLLENPRTIVAALKTAKQRSLDPGTNDRHFLNLLRTCDSKRITEDKARQVSLFFIGKSGERRGYCMLFGVFACARLVHRLTRFSTSTDAKELRAWNLGLTLGTRNKSEVYPARVWQLSYALVAFPSACGRQIYARAFSIDRSKKQRDTHPRVMWLVPHRDPVRCAVWAEMLDLFQRLHIDGEQLEDLLSDRNNPRM